ncbi:anthranilate phosphoribosyltransferase [Staphylococcus canis]|uniref:Anthranilate phosphoribosyltransferase n=1 Tax=Staphylococcus canis TaxID=2724942 RepID=A0ABS0T6R8_9STAP|nr:anthranilate phosphoribosyltransferase [Staphylococcus canis]MBI5974382.1 anthranilate phosphoribosyltransferase [Staphylococcus canis]
MTLLQKMMTYQSLTKVDIDEFMNKMLSSEMTDKEKLALLVAFTMKKETPEELYYLAQSLIHSTYESQYEYPDAMCVCGTGGDGSNSFNISTTASFVVASAGVPVIKHGNKSITSKSGSTDLLEELDVASTPVDNVKQRVQETRLAFISATEAYPVMKHLQAVRRMVPTPTVFNIMGPLINPFALDYQVMGVYDDSKMEDIAKVLQHLGRKKALVVHGANGMDEASLSGDNQIIEVSQELGIRRYTINAQDYGLRYADDKALEGGTPEENALITLNILTGKDQSARRDVVILNAALALYAAQKVASIQDGVIKAAELIDSGQAYQQYQVLRGVKV